MLRTLPFVTLCTFAAAGPTAIYVGCTRPEGCAAGVIGAMSDGRTDTAVGTGRLFDNAPLWGDIPGSTFQEVPEWMRGFTTSLPGHLIGAGHIVSFHCADEVNTRIPICDAYAFIYRCAPCVHTEGGFNRMLLDLDWEPLRCGPKFAAVTGGYHHNFMTYKKTVLAGATESFVMEAPITEYIAFAINHEGLDCGSFTDEASCTDSGLKGQCAWDGVCFLARCDPVPFHFGPDLVNPACGDHCIAVDLPPGHGSG